MPKEGRKANLNKLQNTLHEIIYEADTPAGRMFDIVLFICIITSVLLVMLESVKWYQEQYRFWFFIFEWIFTIIFTVEYILRIYCIEKPKKYILSTFGIVDLLAILPAYISLMLPGAIYQQVVVIRALRLLRIFRVFKLTPYLSQSNVIIKSLKASREKIFVFLVFILLVVTVLGSLIYLIEGEVENTGFTSIPESIYWAIVTLTTVGYGDITPQTAFGQFIAAIVMILGYAVIAVPTGIVSSEFIKHSDNMNNTQTCRSCVSEGHDDDAEYCKYCGTILNEEEEE